MNPHLNVAAVLAAGLAVAPAMADEATFDSFAEGSPNTVIVDGGITFSDLDQRLPGSPPPQNFVIERAEGTLSGLPGFTPNNTLGFGGYSPGDQAAFSRMGEFKMTPSEVSNHASLYFFGLVFGSDPNLVTLEAYRNGELVATDQTGFQSGLNSYQLTIDGVEFDELWLVGSGPDNEGTVFIVVDTVTITAGGGFTLDEPFPGIAGQNNTLSAEGATPGERVYFVYGLRPGSTNVPGCPGLAVDIANASIAGSDIADANGEAEITTFVPGAASGREVLIQAVERGACQVSNLVTFTFD